MNGNKNLLISIAMLLAIVIIVPMIGSCGKGATTSPTSTTSVQFNLVNASPDILPINLFINYSQINGSPISYPSATGYVGLPGIDTPMQIRTAESSGATFFTIKHHFLQNVRYTLYVTGQKINNTLDTLITTDTSAVPTIGRGKVRFVNSAPNALGLDVYANGTLAFKNVGFKGVSKYIELPAGNYNFQVYNAGNTASVLTTLQNTTVQDGKLYTMYTYGLVGRTDTSAFAASVITNR
jgi:hypothetical protein